MSNHLVKNTLKLMTVKEVAAVFEVSPEAIKNWIRVMFPDLIKNGVTTYLNEAHVTAIKTKLRPTSIIVGAKTELEKKLLIQQAMTFLNEEVEELKNVNTQLLLEKESNKPKVEFFNIVTKLDSWLTFKEVANMLNLPNLGRNNLTKKLRELKYINDFNKPYQRYIDQKLFKVIETVKGDNVYTSTVVSQKGLDKLIKVLK